MLRSEKHKFFRQIFIVFVVSHVVSDSFELIINSDDKLSASEYRLGSDEFSQYLSNSNQPVSGAKCKLDTIGESADKEISCTYLTSFSKPSRMNNLSLTCDYSNEGSNLTLCSKVFSDVEIICKVSLTFLKEPIGPVTILPDKTGCNGPDIEFGVAIWSTGYKHKEGLKFNNQSRANLAVLEIDGTSMNSKQMADLVKLNFAMARQIKLLNNDQLTEWDNGMSSSNNLVSLQFLDNTNLQYIRSGSLKLGESITEMFVKNTSLSRGRLEQNSIVIVNPNCRSTNLVIDLRFNKLNTGAVDKDAIGILNSTTNECLDDESSTRIFINLRKNDFAGKFPSTIFKNLLESGLEILKSNKALRIAVDPIDCCDASNSWLFDQPNNYRQFLNSSCLPKGNSSLDFITLANLTDSCPELRGKPASWKMYAILLGALTVIFLVAMMVGFLVLQGDKAHREKCRHDRRSRSESASAAKKSISAGGSGKSHNSGSKAVKSAERVSKKRKSDSPKKSPHHHRVERSKKSDGTVLVQTESKIPSPTSPRFVRLLSPERRQGG